jgi:enamine deaminase RidA (YjgF/YER057c/UK114 family)
LTVNSGQWSVFPITDHCSLASIHKFLKTAMRKNISGTSPYEPIIGFSRAVRAGNTVHLSGTGPVGAEDLDAAGQTRRIFEIAEAALAEAGACFEDVVRTRMYLTRAEDWEAVGRVHGEYFSKVRPAATMVVVAQLLNPAWRVEIEMDAVVAGLKY